MSRASFLVLLAFFHVTGAMMRILRASYAAGVLAFTNLRGSPLGRSGEVGKLSSWEESRRGGGGFSCGGGGARGFRLRNNPRD